MYCLIMWNSSHHRNRQKFLLLQFRVVIHFTVTDKSYLFLPRKYFKSITRNFVFDAIFFPNRGCSMEIWKFAC